MSPTQAREALVHHDAGRADLICSSPQYACDVDYFNTGSQGGFCPGAVRDGVAGESLAGTAGWLRASRSHQSRLGPPGQTASRQ